MYKKFFVNEVGAKLIFVLCLLVIIGFYNNIYAANNNLNLLENENKASNNIIATSSDVATSSITSMNSESTNNSVKIDVNISNNVNNNSTNISGSINNSYNLKEIAGYKSDDEILDELDSDEIAKSMLNDLLHELKPYLKGVIDEDITDEYIFSTSETMRIISSNPLKFLTAIYNYVVQSIKEIFAIAEVNSELVTE